MAPLNLGVYKGEIKFWIKSTGKPDPKNAPSYVTKKKPAAPLSMDPKVLFKPDEIKIEVKDDPVFGSSDVREKSKEEQDKAAANVKAAKDKAARAKDSRARSNSSRGSSRSTRSSSAKSTKPPTSPKRPAAGSPEDQPQKKTGKFDRHSDAISVGDTTDEETEKLLNATEHVSDAVIFGTEDDQVSFYSLTILSFISYFTLDRSRRTNPRSSLQPRTLQQPLWTDLQWQQCRQEQSASHHLTYPVY